MIRYFFFILIGISLSIFETSFLTSSVGFIRFTPFVFAISVYFIQHHSLKSASGLMIIHGFFLDLSQMYDVSFLLLAYVATAFIAVISAEKLFSNRSVYGVLACAIFSYSILICFETILLLIQRLFKQTSGSWFVFIQDFGWRYISLVFFLIILFLFSKQIRQLLVKFFFLSSHQQTY